MASNTKNKTATTESKKEEKTIKKEHKKNPMQIILLLLVLLAISGVLYSLYQQNKISNLLKTQTNNVQDELNSLKLLHANSASALNKTIESQKELHKSIYSSMEELEKSVNGAIKDNLLLNNDWILIKARTYLENAYIQTTFNNDSGSAIKLLEQASHILSKAHGTEIIKIRHAISEEISTIKQQTEEDTADIIIKLNSTEELIAALAIPQKITGQKIGNDNIKADTKHKASWGVLEKLVVIRKHDNPIEPLPSASRWAFVKENLILSLKEAEWGALQKNQAIYEHALKNAIKIINEKVDDTKVTKEIKKTLNKLTEIEFQKNRNSVEKSLNLLNELIDKKEEELKPMQNNGATP